MSGTTGCDRWSGVSRGAEPWVLGHRPGLDQLRAVAVLAVLWGHSVRSGPFRYSGGAVGVILFFTLSGFLITRLMVEEKDRSGGVHLKAFYLRRLRRLLPPLPLALALCVLLAVALGDEWRRPLLGALTYTINYAGPDRTTFSHLWSLAVEEHFYLVWPLVVALTPRRHLVAVALTLGAASAAARIVVAPSDIDGTGTHFCLFGLLLGAAGAVLVERGWRPSRPLAWTSWAALALLCLPAAGPVKGTWGPAIVAGASLVVVFSVLEVGARRPRLERIGVISYGIYLFHFPLALALRGTGLNDYVNLAIVFVLSVPLAELSFRLIEEPVRRRRVATNSPDGPAAATIAGVPRVITPI